MDRDNADMEADLVRLTAERDAALTTLARMQALPDLEWAQVTASLRMRLASRARSGDVDGARALNDVLDRGMAYVARLVAERDALRAEVEAMRAVVEAAEQVRLRMATGLPVLAAVSIMIDALDALRTRKVGG